MIELVKDRLRSGNKNLDSILNGGLPSESIALFAGDFGVGKTTLAHQILMSNLKEGHRAVYLTVLGEPVQKVLRSMQSFRFVQSSRLAKEVYYEDAGEVLCKEGLSKFLDRIFYLLTEFSPEYLCLDGIDKVRPLSDTPAHYFRFMYELTGMLSAYHGTTFWLGTYASSGLGATPEAAMCDHLFYLSTNLGGEKNFQVIKLARSNFVPGMHPFKITEQGLDFS